MTQITFKDKPISLIGEQVKEGYIAPNFTVLDNSLNLITLDDFKGKKKLISVIPSIDTGVCVTNKLVNSMKKHLLRTELS